MSLDNPFLAYKKKSTQAAPTTGSGNPFLDYKRKNAGNGVATPAADLEVDDERVQMAQAQMRADRSGAPVGEPGFLGGVKELGKGLARGAAVTLPEMAGKTLEWFDPEGGSDAVAERGRQMQEGAEQRLKDNAWLQESELSKVKKEDDAFSLRGGVAEGGEMLAPSMGLPLAGAATGFALGGPPGALTGAAAGFIGSLPLYFGAQAQDTYERVKPEQLKAAKARGLDGEQAEEYAHDEAWKAGMLTGGIEAGFEALSDRVTFGLFRGLPPGVKRGLVRSATKAVRGPGELVKDFAKVVATEAGTELAQGAGQQEVEQAYGVGEGASWDSVKGVIIPTMVMSALTFGAGETVGTLNRRAVNKALSDPAMDPQKRAEAVLAVEREVRAQDEELADLWVKYAGEQVAKGQPVTLDEDQFYRDLGLEPGASEDQVAAALKLRNEGVPGFQGADIGGAPAGGFTGPLSRAVQGVYAQPQPVAPTTTSSPIIPSPTLDRPAQQSLRQKEQAAAEAKAKALEEQRKVIEGVATGQAALTTDTSPPTTGATEPVTELGATDTAPVETAEQKRQRLIDEKKRRPSPAATPAEDAADQAASISVAQGKPQKVDPEQELVAVSDDPRLKRAEYRKAIESMAGELQINGGMTLVPADGAKPTSDTGDLVYDYGTQNVVRTPSLNHEWFKRWDAEVGGKPTVADVKEAVRKAIAGEKLGKKQERIVRSMLDNVQGMREEPASIEAAKETQQEQRERRKAGFGGRPYQQTELPATEPKSAARRELDAAIEEARRFLGDDQVEQIMEQGAMADETDADLPKNPRAHYDPMKDSFEGQQPEKSPTESNKKTSPEQRLANWTDEKAANRSNTRPVRRQIDLGSGNSQTLEPLTEASFEEWLGPSSQFDSFEEFKTSPEGRDADYLNILRTPDGALLGEPRFGKAEDLDMSATRRQARPEEIPTEAPALALEQQTSEDLQRIEAEDKARSEAERQETQTAEADAQVNSFTLTGSDAAVDQAEARGQKNLFDQPTQQEAVAQVRPQVYRIEIEDSPFQPEQLDGVTLEVEYEDDNGLHTIEVQAEAMLKASIRRMELLKRLGECLAK